MRVSPFLAVAALALTGCAKYPKDKTGDFTHLIFRFKMSGPVNPDYVYAIAIRPLTTTADPQDNLGPAPVVDIGTTYGIATGRPTRLIQYRPVGANNLYQVFRFDNAPSNADDPDPGNLTLNSNYSPDVLTTNFLDPSVPGNDPNTLGFEITARDLADSDDEARAIQAIQFNILTMNKVALTDVGSRVFDALGDQRSSNTTTFNTFRKIIITTSGRYSNTSSEGGQPAAIPEGENDVFNASNGVFPAIDIVGYTVEVRPQ